MKNKLTWILLTAIMLLAMPAQAAVDEITEEHNGVHPYKQMTTSAETMSHWGLYLETGLSRFDGDGAYGIGKSDFNMDFGLGVSYDFTPLWSVMLDMGRTGYGRNVFTTKGEGEDSQKFVGHMYSMGGDVAFNFMNAFFPLRKRTIGNLYAYLGGGLGLFTLKGPDGKYFNANEDATGTSYYDESGWRSVPRYSSESRVINTVPYAEAGLILSFNLTRTFGLGLKAGYQLFFNDYVDGNTQPRISRSYDTNSSGYLTDDQLAIRQSRANRNNDGIWNFDIQGHWNIMAKSQSHMRNISNLNAFGSQVAIKDAVQDVLKQELPNALQQEMGTIKQALESMERTKDTLVISHKDTLVTQHEERITTEGASDLYFVYFANNRYTLDDQAQIDVQQMATRLQRKPNACLELSGFCDNTGSDAINEVLAEKRAQMVRRTLIEVYGIDSTRLIDLGRGKLTNVNSSFGPNRRVDMRIVDRKELEEIKAEKQKAQAEKQRRATSEKAAEEARVATERAEREARIAELKAQKNDAAAAKLEKEAAQKAQKEAKIAELRALREEKAKQLKALQESIAEAENAAAEANASAETVATSKSLQQRLGEVNMIPYDTTRYIGAEKAVQNTTLSKLARKYYGNTNCWALIYRANKDVIRNASYIFPGTKIYLPILTAEEMAITKEEAQRIAQSVRPY